MGVGKNIRSLREKFGLTQDQLAEALGVTRESVVRWESDKMAVRDRHIAKMMELYGIDPDDIKSESAGIFAQLRGDTPLLKNARPVSGMAMGLVPLRGRVHAGKPNDPDEFDGETALIPQFLVDADPDTYACLSEGDCMNKVYPEGCLIAVSPNREPQNGSVAVVTIDGRDAVMRRMYRTPRTLVLSPDSWNPEHEDIVVRAGDGHTVEFGGRVVWFQAREEME